MKKLVMRLLGYVMFVLSIVVPGYIAIRFCLINPFTQIDAIIGAMMTGSTNGFLGILKICWQLFIMIFGISYSFLAFFILCKCALWLIHEASKKYATTRVNDYDDDSEKYKKSYKTDWERADWESEEDMREAMRFTMFTLKEMEEKEATSDNAEDSNNVITVNFKKSSKGDDSK